MNREILYSVSELKQGYCYLADSAAYCCLYCRQQYRQGEIFSIDGRLVDAHLAIQLHIRKAHESAFAALLAQDKKRHGLTDVQKQLMGSFYEGMSDQQVAAQNANSPSTIRYQRFMLREKARQAKLYLALYELLEERLASLPAKATTVTKAFPAQPGATMMDDRCQITDDEAQRIIQAHFASLDPLRLQSFPARQKKKLVVLGVIAQQFAAGERYSERQVNEKIAPIFSDFATIRRYLIEYGFFTRTSDGAAYWIPMEQ